MKSSIFLVVCCGSMWMPCLAHDMCNPSVATSIGVLRSSLCPKGPVWVQATVKEALDTDTYVIEDSSGTIILFLPTEELEALPIKLGKKILIYGAVDVSPARPEKNELYAEKIILFEK